MGGRGYMKKYRGHLLFFIFLLANTLSGCSEFNGPSSHEIYAAIEQDGRKIPNSEEINLKVTDRKQCKTTPDQYSEVWQVKYTLCFLDQCPGEPIVEFIGKPLDSGAKNGNEWMLIDSEIPCN